MPIIKSAKKRVKVTKKATVRNAKTKRTLREAVKAFHAAVKGGKPAEVAETKAKAESAIDTATKKNVIHKNKGARKKSQLAKAAKSTGAKPVAKAKAVNKTPVKSAPKKAVAKKAPAKKPVAKKSPAKK
ncbi:30S ribosomal protein S20 [Candidatus Saccharibacteria bacterium]|jgi:small subunit ribosomal protein S20|nr:30S ribosomal protein S20 [Candidatus Saccharibacteria bacterium]